MKLTKRETEVAALVADGLTSNQIAERLGVALSTVHKHRHMLCVKLEIKQDQLREKIKERRVKDGH